MKKLMFVAAVAAAMTGLADVEGSNIVGYAQKEQLAGAYSKCVCFDGIAAEEMDIQNIVPNFPEGEDPYSGAFQIMTLTDATETDKTYMYLTAEDAEGVDGVAKPGWFNDATTKRMTGEDAVTFQPGEGFLVISDWEEASVTFAGQVSEGDTIREIAAGANFCGNNALFALDIQKILVGTECDQDGNISTPEDDLYSGAFQIMTLTDATETDKTYMYLTAEDAEGVDSIAEPGWFNDATTKRMTGADAVEFEAGEGFLVINDFDVGYVKIPGNKLD